GQMSVQASGVNEDALIEAALEAGADDVVREEDVFVVTTGPASLHALKEGLERLKYVVADAELAWVPKSTVKVEGAAADQLIKLLESLEELDDVQKVDANFEMDEDALAQA
ncbi:MAG: YebC/PmpR family DNA-binding transcriptional regulator, partial [Gemmatimonas sp.]